MSVISPIRLPSRSIMTRPNQPRTVSMLRVGMADAPFAGCSKLRHVPSGPHTASGHPTGSWPGLVADMVTLDTTLLDYGAPVTVRRRLTRGARRSVLPASLPSGAARLFTLALLLAADGLGGHGLAVSGDPVGAAGGRGQRPERGRVGLGAVLAALPGDMGPAPALQGRSAAVMACLLAAGGACGGGLAIGGNPVGAAGSRGQRPERRGVAPGVLAAGQIDPTQVIYGRVL
jgi:hypothetical protein